MKIKSPLQSGVALVIVLGFLVLISVLVVAFFSSVTTELKSSRNFSSNVTTRQLAESATQVVMGQIRSATTLTNAAWASQPGMIRTYRTSPSTPGPQADTFFKLYSSDKMTVSGTTNLRAALSQTDPDFDANWDTKPALWVDLNSPVMVKNPLVNTEHPDDQIPRFPIIDPRAYGKKVDNRYTTLADSDDPNHINTEGFWYGKEGTSDAVPNLLVEPKAGQVVASDKQRLPMPVRWVYVLQDGTLTSPNDNAASTVVSVNWTQSATDAYRVPSKANPIVGRIAFWTDDETSKVNLNTAGGYVDPNVDGNLRDAGYDVTKYAGSYWDTPRFYTEFDRGMPYRESLYKSGSDKMGKPMPGAGGLAICQLLQGEYQRYPGHPMTTSLGLILGPYLKVQSGGTSDNPYLRSEAMYTILPRLGTMSKGGGATTKGGIIRIIPLNPLVAGANAIPEDFKTNPKGDRLYGSVDELYYFADSPLDPSNATYKRQKNDDWLQTSPNPLVSGAEALTAEHLDKLRFFLTTQSRAPELNLFGRPRVTVWPVRYETGTENPSGLNPFDNVILFCSTIGVETGAASNGRPNTQKAPSAGQSPLQLPGFPTPASVGPPYRFIFTRREFTKDVANLSTLTKDIDLPRNRQLMTYLQQLTSQSIPGFGGTFMAKLGGTSGGANNRDQLLTEIFDYIRCANLQDTTTKTIGNQAQVQYSPKGMLLPSKPTYLQSGKTFSGFGRVPTISEATVVFYYAGPKMSSGKVDVDATGAPTARKVRSFFLISTFNPMQGYGPTKDPGEKDPKISFTVTGLDAFKADSTSMGYPVTATTTCYRSSGGTWGGRNFGGFEGFMHTLVGQNTSWAPHKIKADSANLLAAPFNDTASGNAKGTGSAGFTLQEYYQLQGTATYEIPTGTPTFAFKGGDVVIKTQYGTVEYQNIKINFPDAPAWPVPHGDPGTTCNLKNDFKNGATPLDYTDMTANPWIKLLPSYGVKAPAFIAEMNKYYWQDANGFYSATEHGGAAPGANYKFQNSLEAAWSFAARLAWSLQNSNSPLKDSSGNNILNWYPNRWRAILQPGDTVKSVISCASFGDTSSGDLRLMLTPPPTGSNQITTGWAPHPHYASNSSRACMLRLADGNLYFPAGTPAVVAAPGGDAVFGSHIKGATGMGNFPVNTAMGNLPKTTANGAVTSVTRLDGGRADFDTGIGNLADGPYLNKQDEGNVIYAYKDDATQEWRFPTPYFSTWAYESPGNTFTSPSRQMPSPGMIGSLPRRPLDGNGWETLCFRPDMGSDNHPGNVGAVKDHLLLDLFQMPVVEPYPISEPFSTAGKVNLNYQIQPFTYITRSTAVRAALHPVRVTAGTAAAWYTKYKNGEANSKNNVVDNTSNAYDQYDVDKGQNHPIPENFRKVVDRDATIRAFDTFFAQSATNPDEGFFKAASQICERYLYPIKEGLTSDDSVRTWWATKDLGGDNTLEKPYVDLYPRVTTKSNTYTVHMRVQTLRQIPRANSDDYARWDEGRDNILGEYRGATTIERYIDPADPRFDPAPSNSVNFVNPDNTSGPNLESIYRFRSVINKKFAPF